MEDLTKKIYLLDDPDTAELVTVTLWKARDGRLFKDEKLARYQGATHISCEGCGAPIEKYYTQCARCIEQADTERFFNMPEIEPVHCKAIWSLVLDELYDDIEDVQEYIEEHEPLWTLQDMRLVNADPIYLRQIDGYELYPYHDGDPDLPTILEDAINNFNKVCEGIIVGWKPGKYRVKLNNKEHHT